jgi:hypothetical protein
VNSLGDNRGIGAENNISLTGLPGVNSLVFLRPADRAVRLRFTILAPESEVSSAAEAQGPSGLGPGAGTPGMGMMPGMRPSKEDAVSVSQIGIRLEGQLR